MKSWLLALSVGCLLIITGIAFNAAADNTGDSGTCDSGPSCSPEPLGATRASAQTVALLSMPDFLGARTFYDHGFFGDGVVFAIVDRGWIRTRPVLLQNLTEFLGWEGAPDSALRVPTGHEINVAGAAAHDGTGRFAGIAPAAEIWSASVFTHRGFPWITSPNPPFYALMVTGRFGVGGRTAHVLNNSWNWNHDNNWNFAGNTHVTYAADAIALDGAIVVVAANNHHVPPEPPGDGWNVITVGATTPLGSYDAVADFSNRGPSPSFFRPCEPSCTNRTNRSTVDIVAPGDRTPWGSGTSLAAPLVSGGAVLLVNKGMGRGYSIDPRVIKAVLLNSARPLAGWSNQARRVGSAWITDQPMDFAQGAGQLSLSDAYRQYDAPAQVGDVDVVGWDLGSVARDVPREYRLSLPLQEGEPFVATLVWFMDRDVLGYDPDAVDPFSGSTLVDRSFDDLDLVLERGGDGGAEIVAASTSKVDSVEHIRFEIPQTGRYTLRVEWVGEVFDYVGHPDTETYAIAWKGVAADFCTSDEEAPSLTCPPDLVVECGSDTSAVATGMPDPTDECAVASTTFSDASWPGCDDTSTTERTWTATDLSGNSSECVQRISTVDSHAPELSCAASRTTLWPPNSEMVDVGFSFSAHDECDGGRSLATSILVSSDEPSTEGRGLGRGGRCPDAVVGVDGKVKLRAERSGAGDGRVYRITATATDACGNSSVCAAYARVPRSASADAMAVDSGQNFDPTTCD